MHSPEFWNMIQMNSKVVAHYESVFGDKENPGLVVEMVDVATLGYV